MKVVIMSLAEASKIDFAGAESLNKTDQLIFLYVKGKKTVPASVSEALEEVKAEVSYMEMAATSEYAAYCSYLIGFHTGAKHDVFVVTQDKEKIPKTPAKDAKIYTSFKSIAKSDGTSSSTGKKTSSAAKKKTSSTGKKTSSSGKKTSSTAKKKTSSKKKKVDVSDVITSLASGDKEKVKENAAKLLEQALKDTLK